MSATVDRTARTTAKIKCQITWISAIRFCLLRLSKMSSTLTDWVHMKNFAVCVIIQRLQTCKHFAIIFVNKLYFDKKIFINQRESASKYLVPALEFCTTQENYMRVFSYLRKYCFFSGIKKILFIDRLDY